MEPVADGVVYLHGQGQQAAVLLGIVAAHGEDGQQIVIPVAQIEVEPFKGSPGHHGNGEGVAGGMGLGLHAGQGAVGLQVLLIAVQEPGEIGVVLGPDVGESLAVPVEHRVARQHPVINTRLARLVQGGAEFLVPVHHGGQGVQHGRVQLDALPPQGGDVQLYGHAVGAGHRRKIVVVIFFAGPALQVDFVECHIIRTSL